jgi:hypothetical protein
MLREESATMKTNYPTEPRAEEFGREGSGESIASAGGIAHKARRAVKDTAQKYLDATGLKADLDDIEEGMSDRPLLYLLLAAGAGFFAGGGLATKTGVALLGLFGRKAVVETAANFGRQVLRQAVGRAEADA